jgi:hypothetical protein
MACQPIPDVSDVGALVDEPEGQAALLTAVGTGGPRIETARRDQRPSPSAMKMPANVKALRSWRDGLHARGSEGKDQCDRGWMFAS